MPSDKILKEKQEEVVALAEKIKSSKLVLLTDYRGINVEDVTKLRKDLGKSNAEYSVIKNNITKRALETNNITELNSLLEGPTAVILSNEDYLEPSKTIYEYTKVNKNYQIKGGIIDGKVMFKEEIITLAKLPSREVLIAKLAGCLLANISKLAVALEQVRVQKENV